MVTQSELKHMFNYDPETGIFTRLKSMNHLSKKGSIVGSLHRNGSLSVNIGGKRYLLHRLAFLYMEGYLPEHEVDHINGNQSDNRWKNLRHVSRRCNLQNRGVMNNNSSGFTGVYWNKTAQKWHSQIEIDGKKIYLGTYEDKLEAALARLAYEDCHPDWHCDERCENKLKIFKALRGEIDY